EHNPLPRGLDDEVYIAFIATNDLIDVKEHFLQRRAVPGLNINALVTSLDEVGHVLIAHPVFCSSKIPEILRGVLFHDDCLVVPDREAFVVDPNFQTCVAPIDKFIVDGSWVVSELATLTALEDDDVRIDWQCSEELVDLLHHGPILFVSAEQPSGRSYFFGMNCPGHR